MSTFNRRPYSVASPSQANVKNYFYTNNSFKGLCSSKNFETVDQDTFEDCNNVYVDKFGILRSRPALKRTGETDIARMWDFGSVNIVLATDGTVTITNTASDHQVEYTFSSTNVVPVPYKNAIYFFEKGNTEYYKYSIGEDTFAQEDPYAPITRIYRNGVYTEGESKNTLTDSVRTRYFVQDTNFTVPEIVGNTVTISDGTTSYTTEFTQNLAKGFTVKNMELPSYEGGTTEVDVSEDNGTILITAWNADRSEVSYYVSYDLKTASLITTLIVDSSDDVLKYNKARISRDGSTIYYLTASTEPGHQANGLYAKALDSSEQFSNVLQTTYLKNPCSFEAITNDAYILSILDADTSKLYVYTRTPSSQSASFKEYPVIDSITGRTPEIIDRVSSDIVYISDNQYFYVTAIVVKPYGLNDLYYGIAVGGSNTLEFLIDTGFNENAYSIDELHIRCFNDQTYVVALSGQQSSTFVHDIYVRVSPNGSRVVESAYIFSPSGNFIFSNPNGDIVTNGAIWIYNKGATAIYPSTFSVRNIAGISPITYINGSKSEYGVNALYGIKNGYLYSNRDLSDVYIDYTKEGTAKEFYPENWSELDRLYVSIGSIVYQNELSSGGLYFPENLKQEFPDVVTALHPISEQNLAVFLRDSVYYIYFDSQNGLYRYTKTKLQVGCKAGASVCTSYDNSYVIFPSDRGLAALRYEQLTSSTEQVVTFLSDIIYPTYTDFDNAPIKLYKHGFWLIAYKEGGKDLLVFDFRNGSWWPMTSPVAIKQICDMDHELRIIDNSNTEIKLSVDDESYADFHSSKKKEQIEWYFKSQKLHLGATNYTKHIQNITLNAVLDTDEFPFDSNLTVTTYRKIANISTAKSFEFIVDSIRIFVQRLNYFDVNEFQYELRSNTTEADTDAIRVPLSLTSLSIKYRIGGQVR